MNTYYQKYQFYNLNNHVVLPVYSFENQFFSPDRRGNPFMPGFGIKDWNDSRK